jgi:hypothetical protein
MAGRLMKEDAQLSKQFSAEFTTQLAEYMKLNNLALLDKRDADRLQAIRKLFEQEMKRHE